jgi:AraC family transcriptional regulator of adaptative response/methylated-DNA-[protein]-cysteine methyltransferase
MRIYYEIVNSGHNPSIMEIVYGIVDTRYGKVLAAKTSKGICALWFLSQAEAYHIGELHNFWKGSSIKRDDEAFSGIDEIFDGKPGLNLHVAGTEFQIRVWQALLTVQRGEVVTYKEIAERIGCPNSCRAVGNALGRNPVCYLIPCHRVIKSGGNLGGYAGGVDKKAALLATERK